MLGAQSVGSVGGWQRLTFGSVKATAASALHLNSPEGREWGRACSVAELVSGR